MYLYLGKVSDKLDNANRKWSADMMLQLPNLDTESYLEKHILLGNYS